MAITANMTTHDGVALTNAYIRVSSTYVKKIPEQDSDCLLYTSPSPRD